MEVMLKSGNTTLVTVSKYALEIFVPATYLSTSNLAHG